MTTTAQNTNAFGYKEQGNSDFVVASAPRALETAEVSRVVEDFARAAENAIVAGFDGVEIHGANGYLLEQFMNPHVNDRTDHYGAHSVENRLRFVFEVVDAVSARVGRERVGIRNSPYGQLNDMPLYDDIDETYSTLCAGLGERDIAHVHVMDQTDFFFNPDKTDARDGEIRNLLKILRKNLGKTALILAGNLTHERAEAYINEDLIDRAAVGQPFISNPDLVARLRHDWPLREADKSTYYGGTEKGYIDYSPYQPA